MKSKIQTAYSQSVVQSTSAETIYMADFTERTNSVRKVEIHTEMPCVPDSSEAMDCLKLNNRDKVEFDFCLFDDHQFKDEQGKDISHCECCFFPTENASGLGFVEIKDCKAKNVATYKNKMKEQILSTVHLFRSSGIVDKQKVYGILSFPRKKKMLFNDFPYRDIYETTRWVKDYGIHLVAANEVNVNRNGMVTV
ncbi:MAG: hypothetical protein IJZ42_03140 [Lachnospiraceae bacterium]|nr:hypothetical protein [Lachnospiraceae bacterium]